VTSFDAWGQTPAPGTPVTVTRLNPDGSTTNLGTVYTDGTGYQFSFQDTPTEGGTYTYTANSAGDPTRTNLNDLWGVAITRGGVFAAHNVLRRGQVPLLGTDPDFEELERSSPYRPT